MYPYKVSITLHILYKLYFDFLQNNSLFNETKKAGYI